MRWIVERSISWLFNHLINFRFDIYKVSQPWSGFQEGYDFAVGYGGFFEDKLKTIIRDHLDEIDEILTLIIDPQKRKFDLDLLIKEHGYPDVDLEAIDLEHLIENY